MTRQFIDHFSRYKSIVYTILKMTCLTNRAGARIISNTCRKLVHKSEERNITELALRYKEKNMQSIIMYNQFCILEMFCAATEFKKITHQ